MISMGGVRTAISRVARDDRGGALQMAVLAPVLLILIWLVVQGGLWYNARHVALAAAQQGARAASVDGGNTAAGGAAAQAFIDQAGAGSFTSSSVTPTRNSRTVTVTVTGTSPTFVPGLNLTIRQSASMPVERFTNRNTR